MTAAPGGNDDAVRALAERIFGSGVGESVRRVREGVSTWVYRVRRGAETFYLGVLPEAGVSFGPEVRAHQVLAERGVTVPAVVYYDPLDRELGRSVMATTEISGQHLGHRPVDETTHRVLFEAGHQLALLGTVPVRGFGWIKRDQDTVVDLEAEHPTLRAFVFEHLTADLDALGRAGLVPGRDVGAIWGLVKRHPDWLEAEQAVLAHGDFDVTQIFQQDGQYTGLIDFGEIRGADRWYDLGHFQMHDGETVPDLLLAWLLEGYGSVVTLPGEHRQRIGFASLLIAVRALARSLERRPKQVASHQGRRSIRRDLARFR